MALLALLAAAVAICTTPTNHPLLLPGAEAQAVIPPQGGLDGYATGVSPATLVVRDSDAAFDRTLTVSFNSMLPEPLLSVRVVGCLLDDPDAAAGGVLAGAKCPVRTLAAPLSVALKSSQFAGNLTQEGAASIDAPVATFRLQYEITIEVIDPTLTHYVYLRVEYTTMKDALADLEMRRNNPKLISPSVGIEVAGANPLVLLPDVDGWKKAAEAAAGRGSLPAKAALGRGKKVPRRCAAGEDSDGPGHWRHTGSKLRFDPSLAWNSADSVDNGDGKLEVDADLDGPASDAPADGEGDARGLLLCDGDKKPCRRKPCSGCSNCDPRPTLQPPLHAMAAWRWIPRKCVPRRFSSSEAEQCLRKIGGITIVGDSVGLQLRDRLSCAVGIPGAHSKLVIMGKTPRGIAEYPGQKWKEFVDVMRKMNRNHTRLYPTPDPLTKSDALARGSDSTPKRGALAFNPAGLWLVGRSRIFNIQKGLESLLTPDQVGNYDKVLLVATNSVRECLPFPFLDHLAGILREDIDEHCLLGCLVACCRYTCR